MRVVKTDVYNSLIIESIREMIELAKKGKFTAKQKLNGVTIMVNGDSNADLIFRDQQRAQSGYIKGAVGPYPKAELTAKDKESDARVEAKNEQRRQERDREAQIQYDAHRERVEAKLINAPGIELADEAGWQKSKKVNSDGYGGAIMTYAERWARLMQVEMSNGKKLADVADATSQEADLEGMSGFSYGCAVSQLASCWKHGDELRRWHNLDAQLGDEGEKANESGGVLNPALIGISIT